MLVVPSVGHGMGIMDPDAGPAAFAEVLATELDRDESRFARASGRGRGGRPPIRKSATDSPHPAPALDGGVWPTGHARRSRRGGRGAHYPWAASTISAGASSCSEASHASARLSRVTLIVGTIVKGGASLPSTPYAPSIAIV